MSKADIKKHKHINLLGESSFSKSRVVCQDCNEVLYEKVNGKVVIDTLNKESKKGMKKEKKCNCINPNVKAGVRIVSHRVGCPQQDVSDTWEDKIYNLLSVTKPLGKGFTVTSTKAGIANEIIEVLNRDKIKAVKE